MKLVEIWKNVMDDNDQDNGITVWIEMHNSVEIDVCEKFLQANELICQT